MTYCKNCNLFVGYGFNSQRFSVACDPSRQWAEGTNNPCCLHVVSTYETAIRQMKILGDADELNANNDCPHFEENKHDS